MNKDNDYPGYHTNDTLGLIMTFTKYSMMITSMTEEFEENEIKKNKFKDCISALKNGEMKTETMFWHLDDTGLLLKLDRKDSVAMIQKEIEKLMTRNSLLKKEIGEAKKRIIDNVTKADHVRLIEAPIVEMMQDDISRKLNPNAKQRAVDEEEEEDD